MSVMPRPPVVKDALRDQDVPCRNMSGLQEVPATVRSRARPFAIQAVTLAKAVTLVKAATVAQTAIVGRAATLAKAATVAQTAIVGRAATLAKAATVAQTAIVGKAATRVAATAEEVSTRRRTATEFFRPEIRRECPPAGAGTAIVPHASVETVMVVDIAVDTMA